MSPMSYEEKIRDAYGRLGYPRISGVSLQTMEQRLQFCFGTDLEGRTTLQQKTMDHATRWDRFVRSFR